MKKTYEWDDDSRNKEESNEKEVKSNVCIKADNAYITSFYFRI